MTDKEIKKAPSDSGAKMPLDPQPIEMTDVAKREYAVLEYWNKNHIFEKSVAKESPMGEFVTYDGPPYATGLPHFGHMLPSTAKDTIPRYKTMKGYRVRRRWGWDCHGLPIENLIEKELGFTDKKQIEEYGIDKFNEAARGSVMRFAHEWKKIIPRVGRWVDMENDYKTMDAPFMETLLWGFKQFNDKGLLYEGYKVMPVCPRCGTTLSNHELNQDGGYQDITDISVYAKFDVVDAEIAGKLRSGKVYILAWTTTPWTLPGNTALAVNSELTYVEVKFASAAADQATYIFAKDRLAAIQALKPEETLEVVREISGKDLIGLSYNPPFNYFQKEGTFIKDQEVNRANAWKVYGGSFVTATDGTGIVHIAPAYGEDDLALSKEFNIPVVHHVGMDGHFKPEVTDFAGQAAKPRDDHQKGDVEVIKYLAKAGDATTGGLLFAKEKYIHSYPHCWRCKTPVLNFATSAWFVRVSQIRDQLVAENNKVKWVPEDIGRGRFGNWLEVARDWNISRARYWGTPLPIWRSEEGKSRGEFVVLGGSEDIKNKTRRNKYVIMRHGGAEHLVKDILSSTVGVAATHPLTEQGRSDVAKTAEEIKKQYESFDVIIASPLLRTQDTARIVAEHLGFTGEILSDDRLIEEQFGDLDGKSFAEYTKFFAHISDPFEQMTTKCPGGESVVDIKTRVADFLYDIDTKYEGKKILIVTHEGTLKAALAAAEGMDLKGYHNIRVNQRVGTAAAFPLDFAFLPHNKEYELDFHRPFIDEVVWKNEQGETMKRVPEVSDVWYDSGTMSFAQAHYPFENKENFLGKDGDATVNRHFPADFIAEGLDQTRGWFYTSLIMGTAIMGQSPYKSVIVHGLVLAEDGRKMSKSLNNYPPLMDTLDKYGADSLRYFLLSSPAMKGEEYKFAEKNLDDINKKLFNKLLNIYSFFEMYADESVAKVEWLVNKPSSAHPLDLWIIERLNETHSRVTQGLEALELDRAARPLMDFVDDLSTWYIRRSRDRLKGAGEDKRQTLCTIWYVLFRVAKLMAPFTPFFAEDLYLKLTKGSLKESVHLESWDEETKFDERALADMKTLRVIVEEALALRSKSGMKVRQPLQEVVVKEGSLAQESFAALAEILKDELNVEGARTATEADFAKLTTDSDYQAGGMSALNIKLTEELKQKGIVRDFIRAVQDMRKTENLSPKDKVVIDVSCDAHTRAAIGIYEAELKETTNAESVTFGPTTETLTFTIKRVE